MRMPRVFLFGGALLLAGSALPAQFVRARGHNGADNFSRAQLSNTSLLEFQLRTSVASPAAPPAGAVDKRELLIPAKAIKEFDRSMNAFGSGEFRTAAKNSRTCTTPSSRVGDRLSGRT